jgi:hypothetical protein
MFPGGESMKLTPDQQQDLLLRVTAERSRARDHFLLPVQMDLTTTLALVGSLQLSLRHPKNVGPTSQMVRALVAGLIEKMKQCGLPAHAELMELGNNPEYDS